MVGIIERLRQVRGRASPTQKPAFDPNSSTFLHSPSSSSSATLRASLSTSASTSASRSASISSQSPPPSGIEKNHDADQGNNISMIPQRGYATPVTYEDLCEWAVRATRGELHFYSRMTQAGATSGKMLFLPRLEPDLRGTFSLQPYTWSITELRNYKRTGEVPSTLSNLSPATMPASVSYHVSCLGFTRSGGPFVSYSDFRRITAAHAVSRPQLIVWSLSADGLADYAPVLVIWSNLIKFSDQHRRKFEEGVYNEERPPGLGGFLARGVKIADYLIESQDEYFRLCATSDG